MSKWFEQQIPLYGDNLPFLCGLRERGLRAFKKQGLPTAKTEAWKYSFLPESEFDKLETAAAEGNGCKCCCHNETSASESCVIKFCNGQLHACPENLPEGIEVKPLLAAIEDKEAQKFLNKSFEPEEFPFAALNSAYLENGVMITVMHNARPEYPVYLNYHTHKKNCWANIHNIIVLENGAQATIIEDYSGENDYLVNIVNEIFIGGEAELHHIAQTDEAQEAKHIALNSVSVRNGGVYKSFIHHGEARLCRTESFVRLLGEGASAQIDGMYRLAKTGISDITTNIRHLAPHTFSNQLVKGVADGRSKGVFQGQIHIAPHAVQTEGYQLHKALLLSNTAEIDCKPELEIFADDVKCSHGAVCGDLDKEQLFYMQSRGIPSDTARQILINAYFNEVLDRNPEYLKIFPDME